MSPSSRMRCCAHAASSPRVHPCAGVGATARTAHPERGAVGRQPRAIRAQAHGARGEAAMAAHAR
eukprot:364807-Chlamydomonas_euryale.AAC.6